MHKRTSSSADVLTPLPSPLLTVPQVAETLNIGKTKVYELIKREGLPIVRIGSVIRVSAASLAQWIAQREQASA